MQVSQFQPCFDSLNILCAFILKAFGIFTIHIKYTVVSSSVNSCRNFNNIIFSINISLTKPAFYIEHLFRGTSWIYLGKLVVSCDSVTITHRISIKVLTLMLLYGIIAYTFRDFWFKMYKLGFPYKPGAKIDSNLQNKKNYKIFETGLT